jgi:hypothetical protein
MGQAEHAQGFEVHVPAVVYDESYDVYDDLFNV